MHSPDTKIIGVEPAMLSRYAKSRIAGDRILLQEQSSLADALLTQQPGERNFPITQQYVDDVVGVDEEYIALGEKFLLTEGKILAEPSSSIGIGAALQGKINFSKNDVVCFLISGGNVSLRQLLKL